MDIRQDRGQQHSASVILLSQTRLYHFASDRCLMGSEHMQHNGWSAADTNLKCCTDPTLRQLLAEACGQDAKRCQGKSPEQGITLVNLAGNAQALPDINMFGLSMLFCFNGIGLFGENLRFEDVHHFLCVPVPDRSSY